MKMFAYLLKSYHQNSNAIKIIICPIAVHSPGVIHEVAVPPANKLYYSIAILVILLQYVSGRVHE